LLTALGCVQILFCLVQPGFRSSEES